MALKDMVLEGNRLCQTYLDGVTIVFLPYSFGELDDEKYWSTVNKWKPITDWSNEKFPSITGMDACRCSEMLERIEQFGFHQHELKCIIPAARKQFPDGIRIPVKSLYEPYIHDILQKDRGDLHTFGVGYTWLSNGKPCIGNESDLMPNLKV